MLRIARGFDGEGPFFSILIPGLFAQLAPDVEAGQRYHGKQQHQEHNTAAALIVALHLAPLYIELVVDLIAQGGEHLFLGFHFLRGICDLTVLQVLVQIPFNYDVTNVEEGKAKCKEALQDKFGLHKDGSPVFAMVSRMVGMKGFDLVQSIADGLVDRGIELVILGSGENQYETFFSDLCARHPGRVGTYIGFEPALSQEIYAGADVFIMPSKSEPCGLAQMVACRYGTPPIVRETGGLRDSIHDCTLGEGNGFTFAGYSAHELYDACCRAQDRYYNKEDWNNLVKHDMECDFSWDLSAKSYEGLYNETANLW